MQPTAQRILDSWDDPKELEALYRRDPEASDPVLGLPGIRLHRRGLA